MRKPRNILGLVVGIIIALSSGAHSLVGWPVIRGRIAATTTPADLAAGLGIVWHFAGGAMLAMGIIVIHLFAGRLRAHPRSLFPAQVIGLLYVVSGGWAYLLTRDLFHIFVFVVPGILLLAASVGTDDPAHLGRPDDRI